MRRPRRHASIVFSGVGARHSVKRLAKFAPGKAARAIASKAVVGSRRATCTGPMRAAKGWLRRPTCRFTDLSAIVIIPYRKPTRGANHPPTVKSRHRDWITPQASASPSLHSYKTVSAYVDFIRVLGVSQLDRLDSHTSVITYHFDAINVVIDARRSPAGSTLRLGLHLLMF